MELLLVLVVAVVQTQQEQTDLEAAQMKTVELAALV
jgi:hypothetical protein